MAAPSVEKPSTLLVKNLPPDTKESKLEEIFGDIGPLKRCFIVRDKSDKAECKGVAYVTYASAVDADAALTQKFKLGGNLLHVKLAASKPLRGSAAAQKAEPRPRATKEERLARKKRKPRLIVRNLSFKANETVLRDCFGKYGDLVEVSIPKKPDGKMRGFAFVQFAETKSAIKAINGLNASNISGRPVAVDFCLPKATYQNATQGQASASKAEQSNNDEDTDGSADETSVASETPAHEDSASDLDDQGDNTDQDMDDEQSEEEDGSDEEDEDDDELHLKRKSQPGDTKNTLFIRNISFETTQESLDSLMKQFGPCRYCLLCTDPVTEHSKGSAFVRYVKDASVERCLQAAQSSAGLMLDGRRLSVARALSREELDAKRESEKKQKKDRRNLFLAREGLVRPGTEAAHGVSPQDMTKRAKLQSRKRKLLQNLHYFVSQTRLCVHNLPPSVDDRKLRALFLQNAPKGARITEARVMRNLKTPSAESRGYGFVTFGRHEDALEALRRLNNNPETFGPKKRPIVEFCLENKAALVAKERRLQRSKQKIKEAEEMDQSGSMSATDAAVPNEKRAPFMGAAANRNMKGLPTHSGAKVRTKKGRAGRQMQKQLQAKEKKGKRKQKQKKGLGPVGGVRGEKDTFGAMVEKHRQKQMKRAAVEGRNKWFNE
ncbi:RNA-binding protein 28 [Ixodes scapularis]